MVTPYFKTPLLTPLVLFVSLILEEKTVKLDLAIFHKTRNGLILEGVTILYIVWLNPVKPVTDGTEHIGPSTL